MSIKFATISVLISALIAGNSHSNPHSNPASKEYVDGNIMALRQELAANNMHLQSLINQLNAQVGTNARQAQETGSNLTNKIELVQNQASDSEISLGNKIETVQNQVNELPIVTHKIGDILDGGIVFYVDSSRQHGLIASLTDLSPGIEWRNGEGGDRLVNARAQGLGAGESNTHLIVSEQTVDEQEGRFAALLASTWQAAGDGTPCTPSLSAASPCFSGWYLPSAYELMLLHTNLKNSNLGELSNEAYWSSTEVSTTEAWQVDFGSGQLALSDKSTPLRVRAIHNF
jgi:hypothetical protein